MVITVSLEAISHMGIVVQQYRERMIFSNRAFLYDLVTVLEERNYHHKRALKRLISAMPAISDSDWKNLESPRIAIEGIPDEKLDGFYLPPAAPEKREEFFILLSEKVNDYIREQEQDSNDAPLVSLPEEYMALLHFCDAIQDPDLRLEYPGGVFGTWCIWPEDTISK